MGERLHQSTPASQGAARKAIATRDAYGEALLELGKQRKDVVVLDADLSGSTKTARFAKAFPERFFNVGISEQDMVGSAAGLALAGKLPFCSTFAVSPQAGHGSRSVRAYVIPT